MPDYGIYGVLHLHCHKVQRFLRAHKIWLERRWSFLGCNLSLNSSKFQYIIISLICQTCHSCIAAPSTFEGKILTFLKLRGVNSLQRTDIIKANKIVPWNKNVATHISRYVWYTVISVLLKTIIQLACTGRSLKPSHRIHWTESITTRQSNKPSITLLDYLTRKSPRCNPYTQPSKVRSTHTPLFELLPMLSASNIEC